MAGFEAGASYSIEETRKKFKEFGKSVEGCRTRFKQNTNW